MKFNTPVPQPLPKECDKAAKIFRSFVDSRNSGLDGVIPHHILERAKGFAIFSVFKAGFVFSARAGSGVVIARLHDGSWSAPSAIGTAGLGFGSQAGAEVTDFLIVLNSASAVRSFMAAGSLTLGGNMSLALGPLGRNGEASGSLNSSGKVAAMYSYSKTRGLFGGLSVEGSVIVERQDANALAYGSDVAVKQLLGGSIPPPPWATTLIQTIEACTGLPGNRAWVRDGTSPTPGTPYAFGGVSSQSPSSTPKKKKHGHNASFPPASWSEPIDSQFPSTMATSHSHSSSDSRFETRFESDSNSSHDWRQSSYNPFGDSDHSESSKPLVDLGPTPPSFNNPSSFPHQRSSSISVSNPTFEKQSPLTNTFTGQRHLTPKPELSKPLLPGEGVARVIALYDFIGVEAGDLAFSKGDVITVTKMSESTDDWWEGKVKGKTGIFPANFCEVVQKIG